MSEKISISQGNDKLGSIPSISLPPITTCVANAPCGKTCYALRMCKRRKRVAAAWQRNWRILNNDMCDYWNQLDMYFAIERPRFFRFHVGGDIPNELYLAMMYLTASRNPRTKFLTFTKRYDMINLWRTAPPKNLNIVLSAWNGMEIPPKMLRSFPIAWYRDPKAPDPRIPSDAVECGGNCHECGKRCWFLGRHGRRKDVVFNKH